MNLQLCYALYLCGIITFWCSAQPENWVFIDGIQAVVVASQGSTPIFSSQLTRARLDGNPNTLKDTINTILLENEAKKYRLLPSPEEVEKQYAMIAQSSNKTVKELDEMVIMAGFTPAEARHEFAQISAINSLIGFKITANLVVPDADIVAYYNDHPEYESAAYQIEYALVPFSVTQTKEEQLQRLQEIIATNDKTNQLPWARPFWIDENDLEANKYFITQLPVGKIADPLQTYSGFELFRLKEKKVARLRTLEERYNQIIELLRKPKYTELMADFQNRLLEHAAIITFDPVKC